ncbi:hypothetical protein [Novosphingobium sp.]|uniref:hypothetical protein n=1 Tax=Novosphingobium sp. TaxID=1874826 RepID=UPI0038B9A824
MDLGEVKALKAEILTRSSGSAPEISSLPQSFGADFARFSGGRHKKMLAVGYSKRANGDYALELRVKAPRGIAFNLADKIRNEIGSDVNIGILNKIEIPSSDEHHPKGSADFLRTRHRPVQLGSSIGNVEGKSGTVGGFLADGEQENFYALSCNHVLAICNAAPVGSPIYQPGPTDLAPIWRNRIGTLSDYVADLTENATNDSDSALARLDIRYPDEFTGNVVPASYYGKERPIRALMDDYPSAGSIVEKIGRSSGLTRGTVNAVSLDNVPVEYSFSVNGYAQRRTYIFDNVIEIVSSIDSSPFSIFGDSGSLVYSEIGGELFGVGIVFSGGQIGKSPNGLSNHVTLCCSLKSILEKYQELEWMEAAI